MASAINDLEVRLDKLLEQLREHMDTLGDFYARSQASHLYDWSHSSKSTVEQDEDSCFDHIPHEGVQRVVGRCHKHGVRDFVIKQVPSDYYNWTLYRRMAVLGAPSRHHLCKIIVLHNTKVKEVPEAGGDIIIVIVPYTAVFNNEKLIKHFHQDVHMGKIGRKSFNFRLMPSENAERITGFSQGAMCPVGLLDPEIPIVCSTTILNLVPPVIYLGGGHVDWKLGIRVEDLSQCCNLEYVDVVDRVADAR
eukprot:Clim_evm8s5 gene=Clim_evmTU8s5